jgi:UDP-GlcNAc:undecaprenyl-phosphate/decaprenyl-phosphate GlcNAc-1-phosphate transferase
VKYLFLSVKVTVTGAIKRQHLTDNRSQIYLVLADTILCLLSFSLAHYLRFGGFNNHITHQYFYKLLPLVIIIRLPIFIYFGFYYTLIRHISFSDIKMIFKGVFTSSILLICFSFLWGQVASGYSRAVFIIDLCFLILLLIGFRALLKKIYLKYKVQTSFTGEKRVLIWGAGDAGELCLRYLQKDKSINYAILGFIDDSVLKRNRTIKGVKVLGNRHHLEILAKLYKIQEVYLAMHNAPPADLQLATEVCHNLGLEAKLFQLEAVSCPLIPPGDDSHKADHGLYSGILPSPLLEKVSTHQKD